MKKYLGMLGLLVVSISWGGGFVASDIANRSLSTFQILTGRFFIGAVLMLLIGYKYIRNAKKDAIKAGIILGFFLFCAFALQTIALLYTTPAKNAFLTAINVVFVPFIALVIYKKKVRIQSILCAFIAVAGAGVLSLNHDFSLGLGEGLTLLCAVCFAFQIFLTGTYVEKYPAAVLNFCQMATAFVLSAAGLIFTGKFTQIQWSTEGLLSILYLGAISTAFSYMLQTISQKYVDETKAAIILSTEAVFGTIFSIILLHEVVTKRMILGCALILSALLITEIRIKKIIEQ